jgi:Ca2+-binding RTX toxin-like protein
MAGNDLLAGGSGSDTFVFASGFGKDTVTDFAATGSNRDVLQIAHTICANFGTAMSHASQSGADVVINLDVNTSITLQNVAKTNLTASNFNFT